MFSFTQNGILFCAFMLVLAPALSSQTLPLYPQHTPSQTVVNPAAYPVEYMLDEDRVDWLVGSSARQQWQKLQGPKYVAARLEWHQNREWDKKNGTWASGLNLLAFRTDPIAQIGGMARLAYNQPLGKKTRLCGGASIGYQAYQMDLGELIALHPDDPVLVHALPRAGRLALGAGLFAYHKRRVRETFWGGISMPQMSWALKKNNPQAINANFSYGPAFAIAGWHWPLSRSGGGCYLEPTMQAKWEIRQPILFDLAMKIGFEKNENFFNVWLRGGFIFAANAWHAEFGFQLPAQKWMGNCMGRMAISYNGFVQSYSRVAPNAYEVSIVMYHFGKK